MDGKKRHPIFEVMIREARRIQQNPAYRFLLLIGPITGILLLFFIFQQGAAKRLPIALVDQDNSSLSVKVGNALNASPDVQIVTGSPDLFQAQEWFKKGLVEAIVVLHNELEKKVFQGVEDTVPVCLSGTNGTVAGGIGPRFSSVSSGSTTFIFGVVFPLPDERVALLSFIRLKS